MSGLGRFCVVWKFIVLSLFVSACFGQYNSSRSNPSNSKVDVPVYWVPQPLMGLLHAPQAHQELGLSSSNVKRLEQLFTATDGPWWRSRLLPREKQFEVIHEQEGIIRKELEKVLSEKQRVRLSEMELQAQAGRMLLRPDVTGELKLSAEQSNSLKELFSKTEKVADELAEAIKSNKPIAEINERMQSLRSQEDSQALAVLTSEQQLRLSQKMGKPLNLRQFERIYPLAPPLEGIEDWINTPGLQLTDLKGKVVALHFYAFGCSNCQANLPIYNDLYQEFSPAAFQMVGIHTPETTQERDIAKVKSTASKDQIKYPVAVDQSSATWKAWGNTMWPTIYIIDKQGYIRFWWQGELKWQGATGDESVRKMIKKLLEEA